MMIFIRYVIVLKLNYAILDIIYYLKLIDSQDLELKTNLYRIRTLPKFAMQADFLISKWVNGV